MKDDIMDILFRSRDFLAKLILLILSMEIVIFILNLVFSPKHPAVFTLPVSIFATIISYFLNKKDYMQSASLLILISIISAIGVNMVFGKGLTDAGIVAFPLVIIVSSYFLKKNFILYISGITCALVVVIGSFEIIGRIGTNSSMKPGTVAVYCSLIILSGFMSYFIVLNNERKLIIISERNKEILQQKQDLEKGLEQKEILLKEIHHRAKNNFQIVSSMINLQMSYSNNEEVKSIFSESINRIKVMSIIHEELYQSNDVKRVTFKKYIDNFIKNFILSFTGLDYTVEFNVDIDDIQIDLSKSVTLALLINEILTNSIKYAFQKGDFGTIDISLKRINNDLILTVSDNGKGFDSKDQSDTSLGRHLIKTLAKQLDAETSADLNEGTMYSFKFSAD